MYCPAGQAFEDATRRWSDIEAPTFRMTVEVNTKGDVIEVAKYAHEQEIPSRAVNNAHSAITTIGQMETGIVIWMRQCMIRIRISVSERQSQRITISSGATPYYSTAM
jgi:hypothetical protein